MEDVKGVKGDDGLAKDGKLECGDMGEANNHNNVSGEVSKEGEGHGECKVEKQEILGMEGENDKNKTSKKEGNVTAQADVDICQVKQQGMEQVITGGNLEVDEDLQAQCNVLKKEHAEEVKNEGGKEIKKLEDSENMSAYDEAKKAGEDEGKDVPFRGNGKTKGLRREGNIVEQAKEGPKKILTKHHGLIEIDNADKVNNNTVGVQDGDHAENFEAKKYNGNKHSEKFNEQGGVDITRYSLELKGEIEKNENEEPIEKPDNSVCIEKKDNREHDAEGNELEILAKKGVSDEEVICQEKVSSDQIKQENVEKDKLEIEAELEESDSEEVEEVVDSDDEEKESKTELSPGKRDRQSGKKKKNGRKTLQEEPTSPGAVADRPVRERKTVVRLVEVIEKEQGEGLRIEKGRGIPLKDIPNVAYKLSRRKPEDIKLLHSILFGRKGKAADFKSHISQFSGFAWPENEEKQKAKVKDKLDKCARLKLLDLCDLFDITVSRTTVKKEDIVEKVLHFLIAPHPTTDDMSFRKEQQSSVKRKRSSGGSSSGTIGSSSKPLKKRRSGSGLMKPVDKDEVDARDSDEKRGEDDNGRRGNGLFTRDEDSDHTGSEKENNSIENVGTEDSGYSEKKASKNAKSLSAKKSPLLKKASPLSSGSGAKKPTKHLKAEESHDSSPKVFSRRKKVVDAQKKRPSKPELRIKDIGRKISTSKLMSDNADKTEPSKDELRKMITVILKEVDFNTATFKDILKQLGNRFKTDLTHMKEEIKVMTKEELVKIAEQETNSDDDEDTSDEEEENVQPAPKKLRA